MESKEKNLNALATSYSKTWSIAKPNRKIEVTTTLILFQRNVQWHQSVTLTNNTCQSVEQTVMGKRKESFGVFFSTSIYFLVVASSW